MADPNPDDVKSSNPSKDTDGKKKSNKKRSAAKLLKPVPFEGACEGLKGHVFDCPTSRSRQVDEYTKTKEALQVYIGQQYGPVVAKAIEKLTPPVIEEPEMYDEKTATEAQKKKWDRRFNLFCVQELKVKEDMQKTYALIWGQCSDIMRTRIQEMDNYDKIDGRMDSVELLKMIKNVTFNFKIHEHPILAIRKSIFQFNRLTQGKTQTVQEYMDTFINMVEVLDTIGADIGECTGVTDYLLGTIPVTRANASTTQLKTAVEEGKQRYLAMSLLMGSDKQRFGGLIEELNNDYLKGDDRYPKTVTECFSLLNHWSRDSRYAAQSEGSGSGVAFTNYGTVEDSDKEDEDDDMALVTNGRNVKFENPSEYKGPPCNRCGRKSHGEATCGAITHKDGTVLLMVGSAEAESCDLVFGQTDQKKSPVPKEWILLDNQSTVDVFCNPDLMEEIYATTDHMTIRCNAGVSHTNYRGYVTGYGEVWYDPNGIANILSLSRVQERLRVTYNSDEGTGFVVHCKDGRKHHFQQSERGLFYIHGSTFVGKHLGGQSDSCNSADVALVSTVDANKSNYSNDDYSKAKLARKLQIIMGRASTRDYNNMVKGKHINNCPITTYDIKNAEQIFGPDVGSLKGKTVRRTPDRVEAARADIPVEVMNRYRNVILCTDVMRVNGIPFLVTTSRHIRFGTAERLVNLKSETLLRGLKGVAQIYARRGFRITNIHADGEFESMRGDLAADGIELNVVAREEHVPEVERYIRTVKERTRAVYTMLPFQYMPPVLVTELVYYSVFWLNMFPVRGALQPTPAYLIAGREVDYNKHCQLEFGAYVQTHEQHDNTMIPRTIGALALRPTGNTQGGYYFLSLSTGLRIKRRAWTELPMPDTVIDQVHRLARRAKTARPNLAFAYDAGVPVEDDPDYDSSDDDSEYEPSVGDSDYDSDESESASESSNDSDGDDDDGDSVDSDDESHGSDSSGSESETDDIEDDYSLPMNDPSEGDDEINVPTSDAEENAEASDEVTDDQRVSQTAPTVAETVDPETDAMMEQLYEHAVNVPGADEPLTEETIEFEKADEVDAVERQYGRMEMRPRPRRNYRKIHRGEALTTVGELRSITNEGVMMAIVDFEIDGDDLKWHESCYLCNDLREGIALVTEQMNLRKGLRLFKERGEDAVSGELKQVVDMDGFLPKYASQLTNEQKKRALRYLMYLKEKRCGRIKARGCADGRKQRLWMNKDETSSPTVSLGALMLTCVIDAYENRKVATCDIPGAFLQTSMEGEETVHILLEGRMAELLARLDPSTYNKYTFVRNGQTQIYVELKKALYGTLKAALLFWMDLSKTLVDEGFEINPYDWCVANKTIRGKQCTVVWHVDDLKISHVEQEAVDEVIDVLNKEYGKVSPVTVTRGKRHDYLGMNLVYKDDGSVDIDMSGYVAGVLDEAPEYMDGTFTTPAAEHLFQVSENPEYLNEQDAEFFHHMVAKLLFICKRGRPDIQTAVAFLCTRVKGPDQDDLKKLTRVIKYLRGTKEMTLTLSADNLQQPQWWIDGSFAVHPDMRSHTGVHFSLGKGTMHGLSTKQKINTKSSTEAELVAVDDAMAQVLWTNYFMQAQGHTISPSIVHQDNQSAMLLEKNGRASSSKRTRHINIRYYFITDRIKSGEVSVKYCPTDEMVGDFFTKPLHGGKFKLLRDVIMGKVSPSALSSASTPEAKECVEPIIPEQDEKSESPSPEKNDGQADSCDPLKQDQCGPQEEDSWVKVVKRRRRNKSRS